MDRIRTFASRKAQGDRFYEKSFYLGNEIVGGAKASVFREGVIASHESEKRRRRNETTGTVGTGTKDRVRRKGGGGGRVRRYDPGQSRAALCKNRPAKKEERDIANSGSHVGEQ